MPLVVKLFNVTGNAAAVHKKVAPETFDVNVTKAVGSPEQVICAKGLFEINGFGFTVITCVIGVPAHPFVVGTIAIVTVPVVFVVLINVQPGIGLAVPLTGAPVMPAEEVVVQTYVVEGKEELNVTAPEVAPEQIVWLKVLAPITGKGLTNRLVVPVPVPHSFTAFAVMV